MKRRDAIKTGVAVAGCMAIGVSATSATTLPVSKATGFVRYTCIDGFKDRYGWKYEYIMRFMQVGDKSDCYQVYIKSRITDTGGYAQESSYFPRQMYFNANDIIDTTKPKAYLRKRTLRRYNNHTLYHKR